MRIINLTEYLSKEDILENLRVLKDDYLNNYINILGIIIYEGTQHLEFELLIQDESEEVIPDDAKEYLDKIFDYNEYADDNDALIENCRLEKVLPEFGISNIKFKLTF